MNTPLQQKDVKLRIAELEKKTRNLENDLRNSVKTTLHSMSPGNLLKATFNEITGDAGLKNNLLNIALKLGLEFVGGRLFWSPKGSIAKKAMGAALQLGSSRDMGRKLIVLKNFIRRLFIRNE